MAKDFSKSFKVVFHIGEDILEVDAGAEAVSIEFIPHQKRPEVEPGYMILFEPDEVDLVCNALQLFKRRVEAGGYPWIE